MLLVTVISVASATPQDVDIVSGGLLGASRVLAVRYDTSVNHEGFPRTVEGLHYKTTLREDGTVRRDLIVEPWGFQFRYDSDGSVTAAADAALAAWNALPGTLAKYTLRTNRSGSLDFVPTEVLGADGTYVPIQPLLDTIVEPTLVTGTPTELFFGLVADLGKTAGTEVRSGNEGWGICDPSEQLEQKFSKPKGTARQFLDEIHAMCRANTAWDLIWVIGEYRGWHLTVINVLPHADRGFNSIPEKP